MALPAHLQYCLSRRQRLVPHLKLWGPMGPTFLAIFTLALIATFTSSAWFALGALAALWFGRGYVFGFLDILNKPTRDMDVIIEPLGIGYLAGGERWYVHMDGVLSIRELSTDVWTISHHNGTVINIPADIMPDDCVAHIRKAISQKWAYLQPFADEHKRKMDDTNTQ